MPNPPIVSPAPYVSTTAIDFADASGNAQSVSAANPLPVTVLGGGSASSLADQSVVDAAGVYWLVRDNGTQLSYLNWATGLAGTPTGIVAPAGKLTGEQVRGTQYNVTTAGTGTSVGDVVEHIVVLNIATSPASVITSTWLNITQGAVLAAAPAPSAIAEIAAVASVSVSNLPSTQAISAAALPLPTGAASDAHLTNVQSAAGSSAATAITVQGSASGVPQPVTVSGTPNVAISGIPAVNLDIGGAAVSPSNPLYVADAYLVPSTITWTSATASNTVLAVNTQGFDGVMLSLVVTGTVTAGTVVFEAFDGATWLPVKVFPLNSYNSYGSVNLITGLATGFQEDVAGAVQFRVRLSTAITGTGSLLVTHNATSAPLVPAVTVGMDPSQPLPAGTNMLGGVQPDAVLDAVTTSGSVTSATTLVSASTQGFAGGSFQITSAGTGCTVSFLQSNDNATWVPLFALAGTSTGSMATTTASTAGIYYFQAPAAYVRASVTTYGSGTVTGVLAQKRAAPQLFGQSLAVSGQTIGNVGVNAGANLMGYAAPGYIPGNTNAASVVSVQSPAVPAGASIKASAGRVVGVSLQNSAAAIRSVKFYNATAVTMGTTAAAFEMDIPAGGTLNFMLEGGIGFATGIMWAVTGAKGLTDNTTTGLAANDVSGAVFYA